MPICVGYTVDGKRTDEDADDQSDIAKGRAGVRGDAGLVEDISSCRTFDELPANARDYVLRLEELAGRMFRASVSAPGGSRRSCAATSGIPLMADYGLDPRQVDPEYDRHGGSFPGVPDRRPRPQPPVLAAMRRLQDLAVCVDPDRTPGSTPPTDVEACVAAGPYQAPGGVGRQQVPDLPGAGSPTDAAVVRRPVRARRRRTTGPVQPIPTWAATAPCTAKGAAVAVRLPCSAWSSTPPAGRSAGPASTRRLPRRHPIDTDLTARGWIREAEGRKAFVNAELRGPDGNLLAGPTA